MPPHRVLNLLVHCIWLVFFCVVHSSFLCISFELWGIHTWCILVNNYIFGWLLLRQNYLKNNWNVWTNNKSTWDHKEKTAKFLSIAPFECDGYGFTSVSSQYWIERCLRSMFGAITWQLWLTSSFKAEKVHVQAFSNQMVHVCRKFMNVIVFELCARRENFLSYV